MDEYHALYPELYPDTGPIVAKPTHIKKGDPIEGIFVFMVRRRRKSKNYDQMLQC